MSYTQAKIMSGLTLPSLSHTIPLVFTFLHLEAQIKYLSNLDWQAMHFHDDHKRNKQMSHKKAEPFYFSSLSHSLTTPSESDLTFLLDYIGLNTFFFRFYKVDPYEIVIILLVFTYKNGNIIWYNLIFMNKKNLITEM